MIYIKNIRDIQEVFIPRTELDSETYIVTNKTYENGFIDGKSAGIELQKSKLTNLVVSDNGLYERENGWNRVEVNVPDIPSKTQEKTLYVTKDTDVVLPDDGYDGLSQVNINATQYGQDKRNEGYTDGFNSGKVEGTEEGYQNGYNEGKEEGITIQKSKLTNLSVTANGTYERTDGWNEINVNVPSQTYNLQQKNITLTNDIEEVFPDEGYDALSKVDIDATEFGNKKFSDGHFQGKTEGYEGGKADGIEEGYNQGYEQGYSDGKSESGSCNLIPLYNIPNWEGNNLLNYYPYEYNADGFSSVSIEIGNIYNEGYNRGYDKGYEDGMENCSGKIKIFDYGVNIKNSKFTTIPEWMDFEGVTDFGEAFRNCEKLTVVNDINTDSAISMRFMFWNCKSLETVNISAPNATTMESMFEDCTSLKNVTIMNSSNVTDMTNMFDGCTSLQTISRLDTGNYFNSGRMFQGCRNLTTLPQINVRNLRNSYNMFYECYNLVNFGGFLNLMFSLTNDGVLTSTPNLSYDSCINILNGLYDFTGNGEIPDSDQGKLKVHPNFLVLVGDQISIATNKGWTIISD